MTLEWLSSALQDFEAIVDYIAVDDVVAAIEHGSEIEQQVSHLQRHPFLGRTGRVHGTRELIVARTPYIAVYRVKGERIQILRILHSSQHWPLPL